MKAICIHEHGDSSVLQLDEVDNPKLIPGHVLVDIKAASLNHLDIWIRKGMPGVTIPMPHILGCDASGVIAACGEGVEGVVPGDRVVLSPGMSNLHDSQVARGWDSLSDGYHLLGLQVNGTYCEQIVVPAKRVVKVSERYSFEEWSSVSLAFLTAWHMLHTQANIHSRDTVLIHAAGSGIGQAAIQIAKLAGLEVITTVGSNSKLDKAKSLGADHIINYKTQAFDEEVMRITNNKGVDVIFEHIGPETWNQNLKCLAKGGRLVTCGATSGPKVELDLRFVFMRQFTIKGAYMGSHAELLDVINLLDRGKLKPIVSDVFKLEDAQKAHEHMESRNFFGKLVLKI